MDSGAAFTGGAGNDTFNATGLTLTALDNLAGGAGDDVLNIVDAVGNLNGAFPNSVTTSSIETINITSAGKVGAAAALAVTAEPAVSRYEFGVPVTLGNVVTVQIAGSSVQLVASLSNLTNAQAANLQMAAADVSAEIAALKSASAFLLAAEISEYAVLVGDTTIDTAAEVANDSSTGAAAAAQKQFVANIDQANTLVQTASDAGDVATIDLSLVPTLVPFQQDVAFAENAFQDLRALSLRYSLANQLATAIDSLTNVSVQANGETVTVIGLANGAPLPTISFSVAAGSGTVAELPELVYSSEGRVAVPAGTSTPYDVSGLSGVTAVNIASVGGDNVKAGATQAVTIANAGGGDVALVGGLSQTVSNSGATALSGSAGAVKLTVASQGAKDISVMNGSTVEVATTQSQSDLSPETLPGGDITVGSATAAPTGAVSVSQTVKNSNTTYHYQAGDISVTGGSTVTVNVSATQTVSALAGGNATTYQGDVYVSGSSRTTAVTVNQTTGVTAENTVLAQSAVLENATVTFKALAAGESVGLGGLTFTAGALGATAAQVAAAFANLADGAIAGAAKTSVGTFSGSLEAWTTSAVSGTSSVTFTETLPANVVGSHGAADLVATGTASRTTIVKNAEAVQEVEAEGAAGIAIGNVTVVDVNAGAASIKKGTITTVTASNFDNLVIAGNALSTLNISAGNGVTTTDSRAIDIDNRSALNVGDRTTALTINASGKFGTVTDRDVYKSVNVVTSASTTVGLDMDAVTALTVSGAAKLTLGITSLAALQTLTVAGAASISAASSAALDVSGLTTLTKVDTTGTTGSASVKIDATKAAYAGGAGVDSVETTAAGVSKVISLGGGNDTLKLASGTTSLSNNVSGGEGIDTLSMVVADAASADGSAAFASYLSGFEKLTLTGASGTSTNAQSVDVAALGFTSEVTVGVRATAGSDLTIANLASGATLSVGTGAATDKVTVSNAAWNVATALSDSINLKIGSSTTGADTENGIIALNGVDTATLNATHATATTLGDPIAAGEFVATVKLDDVTSGADVLKSLSISGNSAVMLDVSGAAALRTIDASANTGGVAVAAASTLSATITGGSGDDYLSAHASSTLADTLVGGAGNDTLVSNAGLTTLTGGAGNDTFVIDAAGASKNIRTTITDFSVGDRIVLKDQGAEVFNSAKVTLASTVTESLTEYANAAAAGNGSSNGIIRWFQFEGNTYLVEDLSANATFRDGTDIMVKINGLVDLSNLALTQGNSAASSMTLFG